ncbi:adenosine kinase [Sinorhizobium meliloti]|nr:adenosine kinase [Sinorhizobium meliloti]
MAYEVVCIGNAIMDLIATVDDDVIERNGLDRGGMMLVDADESARRRALVADVAMTPGGSVANTAACLASLGTKVAFIGKVGTDALGAFFRDGMRDIGVDFLCNADHEEVPTANCLALVTPGGERTMSTYLGACVHLSPADIPKDVIEAAQIVFVEGYLLDSPTSYAAVNSIFEIAGESGTRIALTLSDSRCVERHAERFHQLATHWDCDVVIANENEIKALHTATTTDDAVEAAAARSNVSVVTLGPRGAVAVGRGNVERVSATRVESVIDLVGAGDAFAAGFLHAYVRHEHIRDALTVGANCAAVVIQGKGARPSVKLSEVIYGGRGGGLEHCGRTAAGAN